MTTVSLLSTLVLTLLLLVGLFFFVRASVKDRTEEEVFELTLAVPQVHANLRRHLESRSYRLEKEGDPLVFSGVVAPSTGLAVFLSLLAVLGLLSLGLVLGTLLPDLAGWLALLPLTGPLAGVFYWQRARRTERVVARIAETALGSRLTIQAHRDEILTLRRSLKPRNP